MTKCKWCGQHTSVNKYGYCENCDHTIRENIQHHKKVLEDLAQKSTPFLSDEVKNQIYSDALRSYDKLREYKDKQVPFFKSDIEGIKNKVLASLGLSVQSPTAIPLEAQPSESMPNRSSPKNNKAVFIAVIAGIILLALFVPRIIRLGFNVREYTQKEAMINAANETISEQLSPNAYSIVFAEDVNAYEVKEEANGTYTITSFGGYVSKNGAEILCLFKVRMEVDFKTSKYTILDLKIEPILSDNQ